MTGTVMTGEVVTKYFSDWRCDDMYCNDWRGSDKLVQ